jgi:hypothetical protein
MIWVPTIERMSVDFPHPLGPNRPTTSPRGTSRSSEDNTRDFPRVTLSPVIETAAVGASIS